VSVAAFDLRSTSLHLSEYIETSYTSYQNTKTLLHFYDHNVLIPPSSFLSNDALSYLVDSFVRKYYLCLVVAAATIKWIEADKGVVITNHSLSVTFNGSFDHVSIDATSVLNLDLIDPLHSTLLGTSDKNRSLFQILKTTRTIEGWVLCHFYFKPKRVTNQVFLGIDNGRKSQLLISSIIVLKTALDALPFLSKVLKDANGFLLGNIYKSVCENEKYASIRKRIGEGIDEDVLHARVHFVARTQQFFAVKAGIDGFLDIERRSFCDTSAAIHNLANKYPKTNLCFPTLFLWIRLNSPDPSIGF
nr:DNA mismatch repair protein MSH4 [Tanacetum cinerariifolium]